MATLPMNILNINGAKYEIADAKARADLEALEGYSFLLAEGTAISSNADLNDITTPGTYYSKDYKVSETLVNTPITGSGFRLTVSLTAHDNSFLFQVVDGGRGSIFRRHKLGNNASWTEWVKDPARSEIDALSNSLDAWRDKTSSDIVEDANTLLSSGLYTVAVSDGYNTQNLPDDFASGYGVIQVTRSTSTNFVRQVLFKNGTSSYYERYKITSSGTFSAWVKLDPNSIALSVGRKYSLLKNTEKSVTLTAWRIYLVTVYGKLWAVNTASATSTPTIISLAEFPNAPSTLSIEVGSNLELRMINGTGSTYSFQITSLVDGILQS